MKIIELSDHTGDKIREYEQAREARLQEKMIEWSVCAARVDSINRRRKARFSRAWRDRRWMAFLVFLLDRSVRGDKRHPVRPRIESPCRQEIIWREGQAGEQIVVDHLADALDDRWTLFQGYHNPLGEVDQILVGPGGVHAIEVKYRNGLINCDGDRWFVDRYDNYGNCVDRDIPFRDNGGRSPARQLSEPCRMLSGYLKKPLPSVNIQRHVVLSHPSSRIGRLNGLTIDSVCTVSDRAFHERFTEDEAALDEATIGRTVDLIAQSHKLAGKLKRGRNGRFVRGGAGKSSRSRPASRGASSKPQASVDNG